MAKYKISKSLNGDKVVFIARQGKRSTVVARADSEEELKELMASREAPVKAQKEEKKEDDKPSSRLRRRKSKKGSK